jgi:uncharacterized protein GlcG (DUF336 family)
VRARINSRSSPARPSSATNIKRPCGTAVAFKEDTIDLVERAKNGMVSSAIAKRPRLLLAQGGIVIKVGDFVIGAIGVRGAKGNKIDTRCAPAALGRLKDRTKCKRTERETLASLGSHQANTPVRLATREQAMLSKL